MKKTDCRVTFSIREIGVIELKNLWMLIACSTTGRSKMTQIKFLTYKLTDATAVRGITIKHHDVDYCY